MGKPKGRQRGGSWGNAMLQISNRDCTKFNRLLNWAESVLAVNRLPFDTPTQSWLRAAALTADWFEARLDDAGRLKAPLHDLACYYKWPLFLSCLGRMEPARSTFQTAVDNFMTPDGDFHGPVGKSADPLYRRISDSYTNTWLIVAAKVLDRADVAQPALDCLRRRQVPTTGGFLTHAEGADADQRQDIVSIAGCGNAFLAWQQLEEATAAGDCLIHVLKLHDDITDAFHFYIDGDNRLLTDLDLPEKLTQIRIGQPEQAFVYLGMAAVYLARLFIVSGEQRFLDAAQRYFAVTAACGPAVYQGIGCCKTGWCAAVLYRITGREEYRESVHRAAAAILAVPHPGGAWEMPDRTEQSCCDVNGELGYHLTQYCLELAAFQKPTVGQAPA